MPHVSRAVWGCRATCASRSAMQYVPGGIMGKPKHPPTPDSTGKRSPKEPDATATGKPKGKATATPKASGATTPSKRRTRPAAHNPTAVVAPADGLPPELDHAGDLPQELTPDDGPSWAELEAMGCASDDAPTCADVPPSPDGGHGALDDAPPIMPDEQPLAPATCAPRPMPTMPDGSPDLETLAEYIREEIERERMTAWREALAADRQRQLDHDRITPPDPVMLWAAEAQRPQTFERPSLHEMFQQLNRNQLGDAELLRMLMARRMVYDHKRKRWMLYDDIRWVDDAVGQAVSACMEVAEIYDAAAAEQHANVDKDVEQAIAAADKLWESSPDSEERSKAIMDAEKAARKNNSTKVEALRGRAKSIRSLSRTKQVLEVSASGAGSLGVSGEHWDAHPTLMAAANGVVDLETGELQRARPDLYLRKQSPYRYGGLHVYDAFWQDHIRKVFCGRADLIDYFERVIGYAATGLMSHKELYCAYGPTANNGKSQTFNAIAEALGQYAGTFKVSVLLEDGQKAAGPDPDLLVLDGLRMAITSEPKRGAKFSVEMLKAVTGDDIIRARGLYSDPIEFRALCKLFLHTNFIPQLRSADKAFEKRLRVIPFEAVFTLNADEVDESKHIYLGLPSDVLKRRMAEAGPAILSWVVRCARRFIRERDLTPPEIVRQWTREYAEEQDLVGEFISLCCTTGEGLKTQAKDIYAAFVRWCKEERGMTDKFVMSFRSFGEDMKQRVEKHSSNKVYYLGIAPRPEWTSSNGQGGLDV